MSSSLEQVLDRAFGHPRGLLGRLGGWLMAQANAPTEEHVVDVARLTGADSVLILGPGPGVGVKAAAEVAQRVIGVDPSEEMLHLAGERNAEAISAGKVTLLLGSASAVDLPEAAVDVALSVNNVQLWPDRAAGFAELMRVVRPGGRIIVSVHEKALPISRHELADEIGAAGFTDLQTWVWSPPGPAAPLAAQLRAVRPEPSG